MRGIYHGSSLLAVGQAVHEGGLEAAKPDAERETVCHTRLEPRIRRLRARPQPTRTPQRSSVSRQVRYSHV